MHEANYHNEVALNRELYNAILTSKNRYCRALQLHFY